MQDQAPPYPFAPEHGRRHTLVSLRPPTKGRKRKYKRTPERRRDREIFKIVPLEFFKYTTRARVFWRLSCMVGVCERSCWDFASDPFPRNCRRVRSCTRRLRQFSINQRDQPVSERTMRSERRRTHLSIRFDRRYRIGCSHRRT